LSHHNLGEVLNRTPSSASKDSNQIISAVAISIALYSASVLERATVTCFRALQEIRLEPKNTANPPVERLSSILPAQSTSEKALTTNEFFLGIVRPISAVQLTYLRIRFTDVQ
jgi:hypothetical protein